MWGTILTGRNPGQHGVFDFWQRGPDGRFRVVNGAMLRAQPIWQLLSQHGLRCGIVNVPITYPPQPLNGFVISGEEAPGAHRSIAWPAGVYDEVVAAFGRYRLKDIFPGGRRKEDYLTLIDEDVRKQTEVVEYLLRRKPWNFFMVFFSATAISQHYFWSDMEAADPNNPFRTVIPSAYRSIDNALGRLIDTAGPDTTVFIISDCGAGPLQSGVHWSGKGYLHESNSGAPTMSQDTPARDSVRMALARWWRGHGSRFSGFCRSRCISGPTSMGAASKRGSNRISPTRTSTGRERRCFLAARKATFSST
jgi:predicted AlkP superfamily phosphohydrolase/phosphomutase